MIEFAKVRNKEMDFLKEPELLPYTFAKLGVSMMKECELVKNGKKIERDFYARYMATLKELESKKLATMK